MVEETLFVEETFELEIGAAEATETWPLAETVATLAEELLPWTPGIEEVTLA